MSKWCFNYETGDYEDIDKKRRKNKIRKAMTGKNRLFVNSYGKEIK